MLPLFTTRNSRSGYLELKSQWPADAMSVTAGRALEFAVRCSHFFFPFGLGGFFSPVNPRPVGRLSGIGPESRRINHDSGMIDRSAVGNRHQWLPLFSSFS